jgi:hypothetical protein
VFVLKSPETVYIWLGSGSNDAERANGTKSAELFKSATLFHNITTVEEGIEPAKFWQFLGGRSEYPRDKTLSESPRDPRLFHGSNATGTFRLEEIFNFSQDDLDNDDVFILDVFTEVRTYGTCMCCKKLIVFSLCLIPTTGVCLDWEIFQ